jgi:hypothetical protein
MLIYLLMKSAFAILFVHNIKYLYHSTISIIPYLDFLITIKQMLNLSHNIFSIVNISAAYI